MSKVSGKGFLQIAQDRVRPFISYFPSQTIRSEMEIPSGSEGAERKGRGRGRGKARKGLHGDRKMVGG